LLLLRPSIPIGWRLRLLRKNLVAHISRKKLQARQRAKPPANSAYGQGQLGYSP